MCGGGTPEPYPSGVRMEEVFVCGGGAPLSPTRPGSVWRICLVTCSALPPSAQIMSLSSICPPASSMLSLTSCLPVLPPCPAAVCRGPWPADTGAEERRQPEEGAAQDSR